jgi:Uncharacterized protein conserved in bacteria (DUF2321)
MTEPQGSLGQSGLVRAEVASQRGAGSADLYPSCWVAVGLCGQICAWRVPGVQALLSSWGLLSPSAVHGRRFPKLCDHCGLPVTDRCDSCHRRILGRKPGEDWQVGSICWHCGRPYPWSTTEQQILKLRELHESSELDEAVRLSVDARIAVLTKPADDGTSEDRAGLRKRLTRFVRSLWMEAGLPALQEALAEALRKLLRLP